MVVGIVAISVGGSCLFLCGGLFLIFRCRKKKKNNCKKMKEGKTDQDKENNPM